MRSDIHLSTSLNEAAEWEMILELQSQTYPAMVGSTDFTRWPEAGLKDTIVSADIQGALSIVDSHVQICAHKSVHFHCDLRKQCCGNWRILILGGRNWQVTCIMLAAIPGSFAIMVDKSWGCWYLRRVNDCTQLSRRYQTINFKLTFWWRWGYGKAAVDTALIGVSS